MTDRMVLELKIGSETVADPTGRIDVRNPARKDEVVGSVPLLEPTHVDRAVALAERTQPRWAALPAKERFDRLAAAGKAADGVTGIPELLARETGKTVAEEQVEPRFYGMLLGSFTSQLQWMDDGEELPDEGHGRAWRFREPFGVVGAIAPWNYPLLLSSLKVVPALLAGNAVVLVAPATAPLGAVRWLQTVADALPPGLLTVLAGPGPTLGQRLAEHERVRKVSFTGSIRTGKTVSLTAATNLKAVGLELGGNDAALVLDDCVLDEDFFRSMVEVTYRAAGQVCFAIKRVYAPTSRIPAVVDGLVGVLDEYVVGDPLDPAVTMGPLHTEAARTRVRSLLDEATAAGTTVHTRGKLTANEQEGWYLLPSVAVEPPAGCRLVREEQFGPVLPVLGYESLDTAVAMVNDTEYGLASSIWTADADRALRLARRIRAGATFVNNHGMFAMDLRICLTGVKQSGNGQDGAGRHALEAYTEPHAVTGA